MLVPINYHCIIFYIKAVKKNRKIKILSTKIRQYIHFK